MNFSEEYLYGNFKKYYNEALEAKGRNNLALAKDKFYKAASFMEKLALVSEGDIAKERAVTAKRIKNIADSIDVSSDKVNARLPQDETQNNSDGASMEQFFTFYTAAELTTGFDGVIGLDDAKKAVTDYVINPLKYPEAYSYNFIDNKAVLLEGPPGTGKTTFAKAVAKEINQPFALINVAALVNCYVGETGKNIDKVFAYLRNYVEEHKCGITLFFDELDEIAKKRGSDDKASEAAVPALLRNLDGVKNNKSFLIIANTNRKDMLDSAIAERFRKLIFIPLPDFEMRKALFGRKLDDVERVFLDKIDFDEISDASEGLSGRDITFACDDFKYFLAEIKAGLVEEQDLNLKLLSLINERKNSKK